MILGNTYPTWTGSFSSRVDYRGFDLSVQAITRRDFMIRNDLIRGATLAGRYNSPAENFWTPNNPSQTTPRPDKNTENPFFFESRGYEDGSFVRIRNITLGGQVPQRLIQRVGAQSHAHLLHGAGSVAVHERQCVGARPRGSDRRAASPSYRTFLIGGSFGF